MEKLGYPPEQPLCLLVKILPSGSCGGGAEQMCVCGVLWVWEGVSECMERILSADM